MSNSPLATEDIRNRIVEIKRIRFSEVQPHSRNPKRHPANQRAAFRGSVAELGFASVPIAYYNSDKVLTWADGHLRGSEVADYVGDVAITDFTDDEVSKFLLYADPIAAMAEYESQQLDSLLRDVQTGDEALQAMLAGLAEGAGLYPDKPPVADPGPQIDKAEELRQKWGVLSGDLWQLGNHRLICGDCTDKATVERLMGRDRAQAVVTDPPYGIDKGKIVNDEDLSTWAASLPTSAGVLEDDSFYCAFSSVEKIPDVLRICAPHFTYRWMAIEYINNGMVRGSLGFSAFIPVLVLQKGEAKIRHQIKDVREVSTSSEKCAERNHPYEKDALFVSDILTFSTKENDIVYDPFLGSGTTLIACEQLGRQCRAVEISPAYCAVALERWSLATNTQPVRVEA